MQNSPLVINEPIASFTAITSTPQTGPTYGLAACTSVVLKVKFTYVAGSAVIFTFETSDDAGTTWYKVTSVDVSAGAGTRVPYTDSTATGSASINFDVPLNNLVGQHFRYKISATSGSTDSATVLTQRVYAL